MAINFTVSYSFSPSTTISSSQVNTNTSDVANVLTGLEALTKTFAKLKVDVDPSTALEVATKQYVDHYATYRRPILQYSSATVVNLETGTDGSSGTATVQFGDGSRRGDSTASHINLDMSRVASLSSTKQSGIRTGTVASNTWYAVYAVKATDNSTDFVTVADTVLPIVANESTLNSNFGSLGWEYIGLIRCGDNKSVTTGVLAFVQAGNTTLITNIDSQSIRGLRLATATTSTSVTYTYAGGTGATSLPQNIGLVQYTGTTTASSGNGVYSPDSSGTAADVLIPASSTATGTAALFEGAAASGAKITSASGTLIINLVKWVDIALGTGSNPHF